MQGYDREDALQTILETMDRSGFSSLTDSEIQHYTHLCMEADFAYMKKEGILDGKEDAFYDDDDAYDYIVETILEKEKPGEEKELLIAALVDAYMDSQNAYMEAHDLLSWE